MRTVHTISELRQAVQTARQQGLKVAFVPTMGNLHEGHIALVEKARSLADFVVTSIFVNPLQFGANEDLDAYPRTLAEDQARLLAAQNDLVFAPSANEVYPNGMDNQTKVTVPGLTEHHCGASRPGHFTGVATVVTMRFNMVQPDIAVFGEKDFQQLAVIRKMTNDLFLPIEIIGLPTVREHDGLAKSSRNGYLSPEERQQAPTLANIMNQARDAMASGRRDYSQIATEACAQLSDNGFRPDYFNIIDSDSLESANESTTKLTILVAAFLGSTRLIDNVSLKI